jgi:protein-tyrosine phosphatase
LFKLLSDGSQKVFLHCTTGVSRAPTIFLCYLALFVRYDDLRKRNNFEELRIFLKQYYNAGSPNMKVVERVFIEN